jgi:predicted nuclease of predicted toxin-antitoxin system
MKSIVDQPVSPLLARWLRAQGHDALHVRERGMSKATDDAIFAVAQSELRVIITADLDFPRIVALSGASVPGLILFRAGNVSDDQMLALLQRVMAEVDEPSILNSVIVVDEWTIRVRPLPLK